MKKRLLLTLLPLSFLVAACGGNAPAEASSSRATGSSTSAVKSSESSAEQTSLAKQLIYPVLRLVESLPLPNQQVVALNQQLVMKLNAI